MARVMTRNDKSNDKSYCGGEACLKNVFWKYRTLKKSSLELQTLGRKKLNKNNQRMPTVAFFFFSPHI